MTMLVRRIDLAAGFPPSDRDADRYREDVRQDEHQRTGRGELAQHSGAQGERETEAGDEHATKPPYVDRHPQIAIAGR